MERLNRPSQIEKYRYICSSPGHACEIVTWNNLATEHLENRGRIIYVPGLPGDTLDAFGNEASRWIWGGKKWIVRGVLHSGLIENGKPIRKEGVSPDDWISDVKVAIEHDYQKKEPLAIVGHSFGGIFAFSAVAGLIEEEKVDKYFSQLRLITVSSPFYRRESLPDPRPLLGTDPKAGFSYYQEPMASLFAYEHIWDFLTQYNLIGIDPERERFNGKFHRLIDDIKKNAVILSNTDIPIIALYPKQDRWVGKTAGRDLQEMIRRRILAESFDIPSSGFNSMVKVNAHDRVKEWAPVVYKCL